MSVTVIGFDKSVCKKVVCKNCTAILEYTPQDVTSNRHTDYGGGIDIVKSIICPNCSSLVVVE